MHKIGESTKGKAEGLAQKAYRGIRQMLFLHEITPGQKIQYGDLAKRLKMSTTPIIIALKWLEVQGLVTHEPNRGYSTEPISLQQVKEIYDLRELLEISLLPEAISKSSKKGLQKLRASVEAHLDASRSDYTNEWLRTDMEFHLALASLSGMETHLNVLRYLFDLFYLRYSGSIFFGKSVEPLASDHKIIFRYVSAHDVAKAQESLKQHILVNKARVMKSLAQLIEYRSQNTP
jgi:DNA-binding GntR family transcriptional regulator